MTTRPSWDETWMDFADVISRRSACSNRQVGAVIVKGNRPIAVGYNGPPAKMPKAGEYCKDWCPRAVGERTFSYQNCMSVHGEINALLFADRRDYEGGTLYLTNPPCFDCAKVISNSGIKRIVYQNGKRDNHLNNDSTAVFIERCGIEVEIWTNE